MTSTDRLWRFKVIRMLRDGESRPLRSETIEIQAPDSYTAVKRLPDDLVSWDFHQYADGTYSRPAGEESSMKPGDPVIRKVAHVTGVFHNKTSYDGYVGKCCCGWNSEEMAFAGAALRECERHEREVDRGVRV